jgi:hypothetical protein
MTQRGARLQAWLRRIVVVVGRVATVLVAILVLLGVLYELGVR